MNSRNNYRERGLKEKGHWCHICENTNAQKHDGVYRSDKDIIVHHIDGRRANGEIDNLLPVCRSCHGLIHYQNGKLGHWTEKLETGLTEFNPSRIQSQSAWAKTSIHNPLDTALTLRASSDLRDRLQSVAEHSQDILSSQADDIGGVSREFIATGLLQHAKDNSDISIDGENDVYDDQWTIRMPTWMRNVINTFGHNAGSVSRTAIKQGFNCYSTGQFPYGEPVSPSEHVLCPNFRTATPCMIWERTYAYPDDCELLWNALQPERDNPYNEYIQENYIDHGWDAEAIDEPSHSLYNLVNYPCLLSR